ncbi:hypothetical protein [Natronobeatus ordinarius]|uniref:hypothetical protein n=1 Tax=Natronobeatus ordinarius TaxID=2963433 RepID=UPI0020CDC2D5|nr:hypothetical protein [Natronobeatus ordinarius]
MLGSRTITALVGLSAGLVVSVGAWIYFETMLLFLFLPFVPFLVAGRGDNRRDERQEPGRACPRCGFRSADPEHEYCPRDGSRLQR